MELKFDDGKDESLPGRVSKLYLSGIEIRFPVIQYLKTGAPNCTLVELKSKTYSGTNSSSSSPNCTLVELKYVAEAAYDFRVKAPNCTLVELKLLTLFAQLQKSKPPNCTLVELKSYPRVRDKYEHASPNCTLVELKLYALRPSDTLRPGSKLYLSGIEIESCLLDLHSLLSLQIVP